jgi:acyl-coenzyme A synthetase/AMP-(fatty) acid ligase
MPHVVLETWDAAIAARLINEHGVTATGGTPFFLTTLLDLADDVDLSSLREYGVGGASVPSSVIEQAHQHGIMAFRAYGSEHPSISGGSSDDALDKTGPHRRHAARPRRCPDRGSDAAGPPPGQPRRDPQPRPGTTLSLNDIRAHVSIAGTTRQLTPERLELVNDLPRTATGKVRKDELRKRLQRPASASADGPTS